MDLARFLRKHVPGLRTLRVATDKYGPGVFLKLGTLTLQGTLRQILGGSAAEWRVDFGQASMIYGTISQQRRARGGAKLMGFLTLEGDVDTDISAELSITDIRGANLAKHSVMTILPRLTAFRKTDRSTWDLVNNKFVATEAYYAREFAVTFRHKGTAMAKAEIREVVKNDIDASANMSWKGNQTLVVSNNEQVPFGVRGFVV